MSENGTLCCASVLSLFMQVQLSASLNRTHNNVVATLCCVPDEETGAEALGVCVECALGDCGRG